PAVGHRRDGLAFRIGGDEVAVGVVEPDPPQVGRWRAVHVTAERQLHRTNGDVGGGSYAGSGDVLLGMLVNERDRAAQRGRGAVGPVLDGRLAERIVWKRSQGRRREQSRHVRGDQRVTRGTRADEHHVSHVGVAGLPHVGGLRRDRLVAGEPHGRRGAVRRRLRDLADEGRIDDDLFMLAAAEHGRAPVQWLTCQVDVPAGVPALGAAVAETGGPAVHLAENQLAVGPTSASRSMRKVMWSIPTGPMTLWASRMPTCSPWKRMLTAPRMPESRQRTESKSLASVTWPIMASLGRGRM